MARLTNLVIRLNLSIFAILAISVAVATTCTAHRNDLWFLARGSLSPSSGSPCARTEDGQNALVFGASQLA
jgi:hypothetical protein